MIKDYKIVKDFKIGNIRYGICLKILLPTSSINDGNNTDDSKPTLEVTLYKEKQNTINTRKWTYCNIIYGHIINNSNKIIYVSKPAGRDFDLVASKDAAATEYAISWLQEKSYEDILSM